MSEAGLWWEGFLEKVSIEFIEWKRKGVMDSDSVIAWMIGMRKAGRRMIGMRYTV